MVHGKISITKAYSTLGLAQGASLDDIKSTYRRLALATHPDKNSDPEATVKFQDLSESYNILLKHLDKQPRQSTRPRFTHPFRASSPSWDDIEDSDDSDEFYYDDSDEYEEGLEFYMFLFEELLKGRSSRQNNHRFFHRHSPPPETQEQYQARMRRRSEELAAAQERRAKEETARKAHIERERQQDAEAAARRQKAKADAKKASQQASAKTAAETVRQRQMLSQSTRSSTFAAARRGDATLVKKGVWEDAVDAAGGEVKPGHAEFVDKLPLDPNETLLHLAVRSGDLDLVKWLEAHNAEADEHDSFSRTPFHVALQHGFSTIINYFLETYPPDNEDSLPVISPPPGISLLKLATESCQPKVVETVIAWNLANQKDISATWSWICSPEVARGNFSPYGEHPKNLLLKSNWNETNWEKIKTVLVTVGGFTPPPTPRSTADEVHEFPRSPDEGKQPKRGRGANYRGRGHRQTASMSAQPSPQPLNGYPLHYQNPTPRPSPPPPPLPKPRQTKPMAAKTEQGAPQTTAPGQRQNNRGRGAGSRGRGRASWRGRRESGPITPTLPA